MHGDPPKLGVHQSLPLIKDNPELSCLIIFRGFFEVFFGLSWGEGHLQLQRAQADLHPGNKLQLGAILLRRTCLQHPSLCGHNSRSVFHVSWPGSQGVFLTYKHLCSLRISRLLLKAVRFSLLCSQSFLQVRSVWKMQNHLAFLKTAPCFIDRTKSDCLGTESRTPHFKQDSGYLSPH